MFRLLYILLMLCSLLMAGCGGKQDAGTNAAAKDAQQTQPRELVLYSEVDNRFTGDIVAAYNKLQQEKEEPVAIKVIYQLKTGDAPDMVLAEQRTLNGLKLDGRLAPTAFEMGDRLHAKLRDEDMLWYGVFYDPTVFLINQQFSRTIGQKNLAGWADLENNERLRVAIENLSDSNSTQNFLGAFADHYGETTSLNYLWNINRFIGQYAKFPFTPIRMTAVGDADLAITRQSYVYKYLENKFPAYVILPKEGTPVNLYCMGIFKECRDAAAAADFMEWLMTDSEVQKLSQMDMTGFMFLFPRGRDGAAANADMLWLNKTYLTRAKQDELVNRWLERVRFSK